MARSLHPLGHPHQLLKNLLNPAPLVTANIHCAGRTIHSLTLLQRQSACSSQFLSRRVCRQRVVQSRRSGEQKAAGGRMGKMAKHYFANRASGTAGYAAKVNWFLRVGTPKLSSSARSLSKIICIGGGSPRPRPRPTQTETLNRQL